ncbi:MAG: hypothetical protein UR26_C0001G0030 [candidate division TM6 bacterium GW2011_GWF2_32_72]|nr:MAG: hypothetical protein UR26_C0001G0030 [candidate division TM6 bacterium GW2011_GWF2_32_72]
MLKKLTKYGNSNALLIDKAIMELLEMTEGSVVKLKIEGNSLIITPQEPKEGQKINMTGLEKSMQIMKEREKEFAGNSEYLRWQPGGDMYPILLELSTKITPKYMKAFQTLQKPEYLSELDAIAEQHADDKTSEGFEKASKDLLLKHAPELLEMYKEIAEAAREAGMPEELIKKTYNF